jgi:hypothetical protein
MIVRSAMRFCPFCAQENPDDVRECVHCGKRLPAMRSAPARPAAATRPPAPRPAPPRPAPRPRPESLAAPLGKASPADATLKPLAGQNDSTLKPLAGHADATLKPLATVRPPAPLPPVDETHETTLPPPPRDGGHAGTGTLLGIPAQELPSAHASPSGERDHPGRQTKPLSLASIAKEAQRKPDFDEDGATEVSAPAGTVDDGPTRPTPKLDDDLENATTRARPAPRSRPLESLTTTPPFGVPVRRGTPAAGVPTRPTALPPQPPPPPPPLAMTRPTPLPPPLRVSNDEGAFPQLDVAPTPAIPTLALPPMPESPKSSSPIEAVKYLVPLAKAMWARKQAQDAIRALLHGDQRLLDSVLRDLGRVAREEHLVVPALADEMRLMGEQEARRAAAERALADAEAATKKEEERWHIDKGERQADLARRDADVKLTDEDLRGKAEERRKHDGERARIDGQIRAAEKKAAALDAKAQKAEVTPPEKGGGPNTAANARAEAAEARREATDLIPTRDDARAAAEALDEPIATLTQQLTDGRATLQQKRKELAEAQAAHEATLVELQAARQRAADERDAAERELTQRFVTAGTILNLNRVEHPKLQPLFARVDELKSGVNAREAAIVRLESERRLYDRQALQRGLLTVGIAAAVVVLLAIVLIVILAR